jgi:hypothetical protein
MRILDEWGRLPEEHRKAVGFVIFTASLVLAWILFPLLRYGRIR